MTPDPTAPPPAAPLESMLPADGLFSLWIRRRRGKWVKVLRDEFDVVQQRQHEPILSGEANDVYLVADPNADPNRRPRAPRAD